MQSLPRRGGLKQGQMVGFFSVITCNIITIIIMLPYLPILKLYGVQIPDWHFRLLGVYYSCLLNDLLYEFHNSCANLH